MYYPCCSNLHSLKCHSLVTLDCMTGPFRLRHRVKTETRKQCEQHAFNETSENLRAHSTTTGELYEVS